MDSKDKFEEVLAGKLAAILPDEQSQTAAKLALDKHRAALRKACTSAASMGKRVAKLAAADDELLDALEGLNPTSEPPTAEGTENSPSID